MKKFLFLLGVFALTALSGAALPTGSAAPELQLACWVKGKEFKLADFKGKLPVVLFFWTTTDRGSKPFVPVTRIAGRHLGKAVFLGISCDSASSIKKFFRLPQLGMPVAADYQMQTLEKYMRPADRLPFCAIIDRQGKIAWRGAAEHLEPVLVEVIADRYSLPKAIRREKLSGEIKAALKKRDFDRVLALADAGLAETPGNQELLSLKVQLLAGVKHDVASADALLEKNVKQYPDRSGLYTLAIEVMREAGDLKRTDSWTDRTADRFAHDPRLLIGLATREFQQQVSVISPRRAWKLADTAWRNAGQLPARKKGLIALQYARIVSNCGRPDKAAVLAAEAVSLLKGREKQGAELYLKYYRELADFAKSL